VSALRVVEADGRRLARWDDDVGRSVNGTLFHLRAFLAYHGERFRDSERFLVVLDGDSLVAQIPVTVTDEGDGRHLRSPYGGSYGGFALQRYPTFGQASGIVEALRAWAADERVSQMTLTPPIAACATEPLDVLHFALLASGFRSACRDVTSLLPLDRDPIDSVISSRARNTARKATRSGVTVVHRADIGDFWPVLESTFERHGTRPTHTEEEFRRIARDLPDRVHVDVAYHEGEPVAGVGYFVVNHLVDSSFYFAQRPDRRELNGLTLCLLHGLERSQRDGFRWFDFGTSTAGMEPRPNVFRFKEQFGSAGQFRETFAWHAGDGG
jgi:hypothetical protein